MTELSDGVKILLERMKTNPEDFFGDSLHWRFIFAEKFRDVLTEPEKGMIHESLKNLRRVEFGGLVVAAILRDGEERAMEEKKVADAMAARSRATGNRMLNSNSTTSNSRFSVLPMQQSGQIASQYDTSLQSSYKP